MESPILFDQQKLTTKFEEIADKTDNKIDIQLLKQLLTQLDLQKPNRTVQKLVSGLYYSNKAKLQSTAAKAAQALKKAESVQQKQEIDSQQQQKQKQEEVQQSEFSYRINQQQALKCAQLITNKIKNQIWKMTSAIYQLQYNLSKLSKRTAFPIRDPSQNAKITVLVGQEMPTYNSFLHAKLQKNGNRLTGVKKEGESGMKMSLLKKQSYLAEDNNFIKLLFSTENRQSSEFLSGLWTKIFQLITAMVTGELADGDYFLSTMKITPEIQDNCFQLTIKSQNKDLNQFLFACCNFLNIILKCDVRFLIQMGLQFSFNLKELIENPKSSLYDFLAKNIRLRFKYQGSQYVTAIKQLMIESKAFDDLQYVAEDPFTLNLIALISTHFVELNLKFKNVDQIEAERQTLRQMIYLIQQQLTPMLQKLKEEMPDVYQMMVNAVRKTIKIQANICDFSFQGELYLENIDLILFQKNNIFQDMDEEGESQHKSEGAQSKQNENEQQKQQEEQKEKSFQKLDGQIVDKQEQSQD